VAVRLVSALVATGTPEEGQAVKTNAIYKSDAGEEAVLGFYDSVLDRWPLEKETRRLSTRHGETFVITSGTDGLPPLVLLHGAASNATSWVGDVVEYGRHFRVHAVDIPGEPGRSAPNRLSWKGAGYAEWLEDVLDGLHIGTTHLLGLSQGGWTAIRFAVSHPERVNRLVLLAPGGVVPTKASFLVKAIFCSLFGAAGARKLNQIVMGRQQLHPDAIIIMNTIMRHFKARIEKEYIFSDEELSRLTMPVLFLGGAQDAILAASATATRLAKWIPELQSHVIPEMGHCLVNLAREIIPYLTQQQTPAQATGSHRRK
jgi:pimeloyl-ACP methyl ester carboxylesterase